MTGPRRPAGEHRPLRHWDRDLGRAPNPSLLSPLTPALPPPPAPTLLPFCLQFCAENASSRPRATVTPAPGSPGIRPPNKKPPPSLSANTIKGPALPSESVSLAGKPGTGSGMLSHPLAVKRVISMGVFILLQEEPGKMPPELWPGHHPAAPTPAFPPAQAVGQCPALAVRPCLAGAPTQEDSGKQTFWPPHLTFPCAGESQPQLFPYMATSSAGRLPWGKVPCMCLTQEGAELAPWPPQAPTPPAPCPLQYAPARPLCPWGSQPGPLPQPEEGPECRSRAGASAPPGTPCQVLPPPVAPAHTLTLSLPSGGQYGFERASF